MTELLRACLSYLQCVLHAFRMRKKNRTTMISYFYRNTYRPIRGISATIGISCLLLATKRFLFLLESKSSRSKLSVAQHLVCPSNCTPFRTNQNLPKIFAVLRRSRGHATITATEAANEPTHNYQNRNEKPQKHVIALE